jgi:hypothetical protein
LTHGNADISASKRGRVVNTVTSLKRMLVCT